MADSGRGLMAVTLGALGVLGLFCFAFVASRLGIPFAVPVGLVGALATGYALHGPLGQAIGRRLEGRSPPEDDSSGPLLAELEELRHRVQELEERVDFSERLLAQHSRTPEA